MVKIDDTRPRKARCNTSKCGYKKGEITWHEFLFGYSLGRNIIYVNLQHLTYNFESDIDINYLNV